MTDKRYKFLEELKDPVLSTDEMVDFECRKWVSTMAKPDIVGQPCPHGMIIRRAVKKYNKRKRGLLRRFVPDNFTAWLQGRRDR
jgi:hypothetical protein